MHTFFVMNMLFPMQIATLRRLVVEEDGQDLIEYALLTGAIGFAAVVGIGLIGAAINTVYTSWDGGVNSLWVPPDPV